LYDTILDLMTKGQGNSDHGVTHDTPSVLIHIHVQTKYDILYDKIYLTLWSNVKVKVNSFVDATHHHVLIQIHTKHEGTYLVLR